MTGINSAFFFVIDKIISLQAFFIDTAWAIGRIVLFIALISAAINYGLTGEGLKSNLIKIAKATLFFIVIMFAYPSIIGQITQWTFSKAEASTYNSIKEYIRDTEGVIAGQIDDAASSGKNGTYGTTVTRTVSADKNPMSYFSEIITYRPFPNNPDAQYAVVAPAAVLRVVLLIAGECMRFSDEAPSKGLLPDFGAIVKGMICAFAVILTGILATIEYLITFMEFMLVTSVGIILFPLSIWEGSKFMAEKLIGAITGFFIKLLFSNICIFLMLFGFISLAKQYTNVPFTGLADEIISLLFTCLMFFFICKSAPGLAQSLLTGAPSLNAAGAIGAVGGAIGAAGAVLGMAKSTGGALAGGGAKAILGGAGALTQANAAAQSAGKLGGGFMDKAGAFATSLGMSAKETAKSAGSDLTRSLLSGGKNNSGGGSTSGGINSHSQRQQHLAARNEDGSRQTFDQYLQGRKNAGSEIGLNHMVIMEEGKKLEQAAKRQKSSGENA
jgi:hypothetical protein